MRILTTLAGAVAGPDGYQPQLRQLTQPDGFQPQLREGPASDAFDRYRIDDSTGSADTGGAALHPDSKAVRPGVVAEAEPGSGSGRRSRSSRSSSRTASRRGSSASRPRA